MVEKRKWTLATTSLAGCFGCHMSFLDIDERILQLVEWVDFNKSPFDDIKYFTQKCDIGLVEGGCCNSDNVRVLRAFRENCRHLISVGQCAITGGLPAMRNGVPIRELFEEAFVSGPTVAHQKDHIIPNDDDIPHLLDRVYPCHEIVKIDGFLPGCPPKADLLWQAIQFLIAGRPLSELPIDLIRYD